MHEFEEVLALMREGQLAEARKRCSSLISADTPQPELMTMAAALANLDGNHREALQLIQQAHRIAPSESLVRDMANLHAELGEHAASAALWDELLNDAGNPEDSAAAGVAHQRLGDFTKAALCYQASLAHRAEPSVHFNLATVLNHQGRSAEAIEELRKAVALDPEHARAWCNLGVFVRSQDLQEAIDCLHRAIELQPGYAEALGNLASAMIAARKDDEARSYAQAALAARPGDALAELVLATIALHDEHFEDAESRLRSVIAAGPPAKLHGDALVALGRVLDRVGRFEEAFEIMSAGQSLLSQMPKSRAFSLHRYPKTVRSMRRWVESHSDWNVSDVESSASEPIFLVGFPRSGTTLMEQILAAQGDVETVDEDLILRELIRDMPIFLGRPLQYPQLVEELSAEEVLRVRAHYLQLVGRERRFVDKFPLNIVHLPLIHRLFPDAHILVMLRDPRDCVLSGFFQDLTPNDAMVHFYDTTRLARLYADVMGLWCELRKLPGLKYREQRYEDLVADFAGQVPQILEFLGLPWNESVLSYHEKAAQRQISTPSYHDVSQPIYSRSLQRWRNYPVVMETITPTLQPFIDAFGYGEALPGTPHSEPQ